MSNTDAGSKLEARYQFHTRLSVGGMGEVSTAWDTQLKRTVAIKRMKSGGMELVQGTLQEAMRMASIRHPNIVTVYDIGMDEGTPYIVMEFVNGETLEEKVEKGVLELDEFVDIAQQTFNGLIASRPIKTEEAGACAAIGLGDMLSPACEHVIGLDGIAVLVNRANPISSLTKQQIADLFTGKITDWSQVGGTAGTVNLYARDSKSGTFDTFKSLVLGSGTDSALSPQAKRFEDNSALSDSIAADPDGIGFAGLPFVRNAKALAVSEPGTLPLMATPFTVATEDYLLARRLFIYTPANPQNPMTRKFVEFVLGDRGQEVVSASGFVKLTPDVQHPAIPDNAPKEYTSAVKDAERLSLDFRFRPNSTDLDNKSLRDLDRITNLLLQSEYRDCNLMLLGFADARGGSGVNMRLSKERAKSVANELEARGITPELVTGFGSALPVASNDTDQGRDKNRRVEVWLVNHSKQIGKM